MENEYGIFEECEKPSDEVRSNKKANVNYWDSIEAAVEELIKNIARDGGILIEEFTDFDLIKEATELITTRLTERFGAEFPYVDENF